MQTTGEGRPGAGGIRSMTGFAQARGQNALGSVTVQLKAVNHRFLDIHLHCPSMLDAWSLEFEKQVRQRLHRGHIDVTISAEPNLTGEPQLNRGLIEAYIRAHALVARELNQEGAQPEVAEILRLPGVLAAESTTAGIPGPEDAGWGELLLGTLGECLDQLDRMREQEGSALREDLRRRVERLGAATGEIEGLREQLDEMVFTRLQRRMHSFLAGDSVPTERLVQEAALVAERSDVSEELTRLRAHLEQFSGLLADGGEVGRKLDFVLQELNREVNTMLSKTSGVACEGLRISELGVEMKAEIEKLREQVQNVE